MIMTRDDTIVLLTGIMKYCENHWMFADLDEKEIADSYADLNRFDSDRKVAYGLIEWLEDEKDCLEEIRWSIDLALDVLRMTHPNHKDYLDEF